MNWSINYERDGFPRVVNLSPDFKPTRFQEISFDLGIFSGGESHVKLLEAKNLLPAPSRIIITHRLGSMNHLMQAALVKDALREFYHGPIELFTPYLPYARQDRRCESGEAFSLKVYAGILNSIGFDRVHILDPHSDVGPALIDNCVVHSPSKYVKRAVEMSEAYYLISPDAGASKSVASMAKELDMPVVQAVKHRDTTDGRVHGFEVAADHLLGEKCMVVDDICDGGATFIGLAKQLKAKGAGDLYLYVTHGIFSNGVDELKKYYKQIYTTNSVVNLKMVETFSIAEVFADWL